LKRKTPKVKDIVRIVILVLCGVALGVNLYHANASKLVGNQLPMPFGFGTAVVLSGSMEPAISVNDLIIVSENKRYAEGDIVVYQDGGSLVVHRVIEIDGNEIITKGDANNVADNPMEKSLVKGTVIGIIPGIGSLVRFIKTPTGTILFVLAAIVLIELPYRMEKKRDDEKRQQIIDEINRLKDGK